MAALPGEEAPSQANGGPSGAAKNGTPARSVALLNPRCVVCGHENPHGLQLNFTVGPDGAMAEWTPETDWESFQGTIHGGIISTVLDEAMSKAIIAQGLEAFTVDLRVRFKEKPRTGERTLVRGWMVQKRKRRITAEASIFTYMGQEQAHAWGVFLVPQQSSSARPASAISR